MNRLDVAINQPEFLMVERKALLALVDKHEQYLGQGRDLEARGVERAIGIVWNVLKGNFSDTQPTSCGALI